jgi:hypothetical protein
LRWAKAANCAPTDETFVATELPGVMTGEIFALIGVIFTRTGGSCGARFGTETTEKPVIFGETSGMTSEICAPIGTTCAMIVVTSGMTVAAFDATTEGKFSSVPWGRAARAAAGESCRRL